MKTLIDCRPGEFYELAGLFLLPTQDLKASTEISLGPKLPLSCMFEIHFAMIGTERVGYFFKSRFEVVNGGGYLQTYMKGKGPAVEHETLIKDETLVVYNFPNRGALAVSPLVNSEIETILTEQ